MEQGFGGESGPIINRRIWVWRQQEEGEPDSAEKSSGIEIRRKEDHQRCHNRADRNRGALVVI